MKKLIYFVLGLTLILFVNACSSVQVLNSWKADDVSSIKDNNFIVIARTANNQARVAFENEIVKQLSEKGMKATASYTKFPQINPDQKVTEEQVDQMIGTLEDAGFNAIVLTVLKEVENVTQTNQDGGYYAGGTYAGYYPRYYGGFGRYYGNPMSYSTYGNYVPPSYTTSTYHNYVLETVIYDLDTTTDTQLVAVVTSKIEDPGDVTSAAKDYVKAITKSLVDKK